jgi:hypothetical protein
VVSERTNDEDLQGEILAALNNLILLETEACR